MSNLDALDAPKHRGRDRMADRRLIGIAERAIAEQLRADEARHRADGEGAEDLVHGFCQACQKRGLPRSAMSDQGAGMRSAEFRQGMARLGVAHEMTLPHSPYQNGKQEAFWTQLEARSRQAEAAHADLMARQAAMHAERRVAEAALDAARAHLAQIEAERGNGSASSSL